MFLLLELAEELSVDVDGAAVVAASPLSGAGDSAGSIDARRFTTTEGIYGGNRRNIITI